MELRMVGRRSLSGSMTLVGDIAQATGPGRRRPGTRWWPTCRAGAAGAGRPVGQLPGACEVMELARRVLAAALPGVAPPEPVRHTGQAPRFLSSPPGQGGSWCRSSAALSSRSRGRCRRARPGRGRERGRARARQAAGRSRAPWAGGIDVGEVGAGALDAQVSLLALADAKGLEFDSVVVVEPARIVAEAPRACVLFTWRSPGAPGGSPSCTGSPCRRRCSRSRAPTSSPSKRSPASRKRPPRTVPTGTAPARRPRP